MAVGTKTGGRRPGSPNKATAATAAAAKAAGITPLEYMLNVLRDKKTSDSRRDWAANAAAPYIHPKLSTLQSHVNLTGRLTLEQLVAGSIAKDEDDKAV